jgi:predicted DCC family thiol-disulfide oxidoreductase YuxK
MGWTGGQYSIYRGTLALVVAALLSTQAFALANGRGRLAAPGAGFVDGVQLALIAAGFVLAAVLVAALAAGRRDRLAAQLLAPFLLFAELIGHAPTFMPALGDAIAGRTALVPALLLLLHARVPAAPFGALDARDRTDPRGDWQRPAWQTDLGWLLLTVVLAARLGLLWQVGARDPLAGRGFALAAGGLELGLAALGLGLRRGRRTAWSVLALFGLAWAAAARTIEGAGLPELASGSLNLGLLLIFACEPTWWSGRRLASADRAASAPGKSRADRAGSPRALPARLFYDGDCGFCHRSVRFILSEELATPADLRLRFAPLGSDTFRERMADHPELDPASLPDSIVLELEDGRILTRSTAALEIASRLGGFWRLVALAGRLVPMPVRDAGYDAIARVRKRLFAQPKDACPILPPDLRSRFDR